MNKIRSIHYAANCRSRLRYVLYKVSIFNLLKDTDRKSPVILSVFCMVMRLGLPHFLKCTLVQVLRLCTGRTAQRGSRGIVLRFHDHGTRRG